MIQNMAYLLLVALLMGLAALLGERVCAERNWPRRGVWLAALLASVALPAYTFVIGTSATANLPIVSLPLLVDTLPTVDTVDSLTIAAGTAPLSTFSWPAWQAFDSPLIWLWAGSTASLLVLYGLALLRVRRILSEASPRRIGGQDVLLSDRLGPAVLGFVKPRIVLPHWLAEQETAFRTLVVRHEREHIAARDQLSLLAALLLVATMPWNPALWWQLRRLRTAIEFDCDRRVLRTGANPREYSEALLTVGSRAPRTPFAAVALTEPVSVLEQRIRGMLVQARKLSLAACGARAFAALSALGLAFAVNAPNAQLPADTTGGNAQGGQAPDSPSPTKSIPAMRLSISDQFTAANVCLEQGDTDCVYGILDQIAAMQDLNVYETGQLQNFHAYVAFETDNLVGAITAYETILALPQGQLPDGLISSSMRNLATLYLQAERLQEGLNLFEGWLALPYITPGAGDHYLRASIYYQLGRYAEAIAPAEEAIAIASEPERNHYELLLVLQSQTGDQAGVAETLEILDANWPDEDRSEAFSADAPVRLGRLGFRVSDGEYLPIVKIAPAYPPSALAQRVEGYVIVSYTVSRSGETEDVRVVESSSSLFDAAAVESAKKYKYKPRIIDGTPVEVAGVTTRIEFVLE